MPQKKAVSNDVDAPSIRDLFVSCFSRAPQLAAIGELHANQAEITAHGQRLVRNASLVGVVLRTSLLRKVHGRAKGQPVRGNKKKHAASSHEDVEHQRIFALINMPS